MQVGPALESVALADEVREHQHGDEPGSGRGPGGHTEAVPTSNSRSTLRPAATTRYMTVAATSTWPYRQAREVCRLVQPQRAAQTRCMTTPFEGEQAH